MIIYRLILISLCTLIFACRNNTKNETLGDAVATFSTVRLDSATSNVHRTVIYPLFMGENAENLNGALLRMFTGDSLPVKSMRQFLNKQNVFEQYVTDMKGSNTESEEYAMEYEMMDSVFVLTNKPNIVTLANSFYYYLGGAHGIGEVHYKNINPKTGKTYNLDDFFKPNYLPALTKIGEQCFRTQFLPNMELKPTADLSEENGFWFDVNKKDEDVDNIFYLPENFAVTNDGITFAYAHYEVGPYAMGIAEFKISFDQLKSLLKEEWLSNG